MPGEDVGEMYKFDGHESKPAMCILAIIQESQNISTFSYFATYSLHDPNT